MRNRREKTRRPSPNGTEPGPKTGRKAALPIKILWRRRWNPLTGSCEHRLLLENNETYIRRAEAAAPADSFCGLPEQPVSSRVEGQAAARTTVHPGWSRPSRGER